MHYCQEIETLLNLGHFWEQDGILKGLSVYVGYFLESVSKNLWLWVPLARLPDIVLWVREFLLTLLQTCRMYI